MLNPFRINGLGDISDEGSTGYDPLKTTGSGNSKAAAATVQLSAVEYDETISKVPEATLTYLDVDDGETITVGSSRELAQCLAEPLPPMAHILPPDAGVDNYIPMHIFDIRRTRTAVDTWQAIQARGFPGMRRLSWISSRSPSPLELNDPASNSANLFPILTEIQGSNSQTGENTGDARLKWFHSCDPPQVTNPNEDYNQEGGMGFTAEAVNDATSDPECRSISPENQFITNEGMKQAQSAGVKLRNARSSYQMSSANSSSSFDQYKDTWNIYQTSPQSFNALPLSEREPDAFESPIEINSQPLLASFEAELSKLMKQASQSEQSTDLTDSQDRENSCPTGHTTGLASSPENGASEKSPEPIPLLAEVFGKPFHTLLNHVDMIISELTTRLPEVEQRMSCIHDQIPEHMQVAVKDTVSAIGGQIQTLAGVMQQAVTSAHTASGRRIEAENLIVCQMNALKALASKLGEPVLAALEKNDKSQRELNETILKSSNSKASVSYIINGERNTSKEHDVVSPVDSISSTFQFPSLTSINPTTVLEPVPSSLNDTKQQADTALGIKKNAKTSIFIRDIPNSISIGYVEDLLKDQGFVGEVINTLEHGEYIYDCYVRFPTIYAAMGAVQALTQPGVLVSEARVEFGDSFADSNACSTKKLQVGRSCGRKTRIIDSNSKQITKQPSVTFDLPDNGIRDTESIKRTRSMGDLRSAQQCHVPMETDDVYRDQSNAISPVFSAYGEEPVANRVDGKEPICGIPPCTESLLDGQVKGSNLATRYPSLLATQKLPIGAPFERPSQGSDSSRYPSMRQLETRLLLSHHPQPFLRTDRRTRVNRATDRFSLPAYPSPTPTAHNHTVPEYAIPGTYDRNDDYPQYPPPVPDKLPGAWPRTTEWRRQGDKNRQTPHGTEDRTDSPENSTGTWGRSPMPNLPGPFKPLYEIPASGNNTLKRHFLERSHENRPKPFPRFYARPNERPNFHEGNRHLNDCRYYANTPGSFPTETEFQEPVVNEPTDKVETCVKHLTALGYGDKGISRLRVYAQAANGDLDDAIEMIEEERKAYEQRAGLL
ncbi:hypothetical protein FQN57_004945 [Myotisia sp. PD_48]|nr:hypothetical protein FQN57_004945 [Myotisia sp. PD_48]